MSSRRRDHARSFDDSDAPNSDDDGRSKRKAGVQTSAIPKKKSKKSNNETGESLIAALQPSSTPPPALPQNVRPKKQLPGSISNAATTTRGPPKPATKVASSPNRGVKPAAPTAAVKLEDDERENPKSSESNAAKPIRTARTIIERVVMEDLRSLCQTQSRGLHYRIMPNDKGGIDLNGSFSRPSENAEDLDFLDTNERGEIVLEQPPPIFPDELPPGKREHTLSWWGILDPAVGDGKYRLPLRHGEYNSDSAREQAHMAALNPSAPTYPAQPMHGENMPSHSSRNDYASRGGDYRGGGGGPPGAGYHRYPPPPQHSDRNPHHRRRY